MLLTTMSSPFGSGVIVRVGGIDVEVSVGIGGMAVGVSVGMGSIVVGVCAAGVTASDALGPQPFKASVRMVTSRKKMVFFILLSIK